MSKKNVPFENEAYPAAQLNEDGLTKLRALEDELRNETGSDVVLIAYEDHRDQL
ncbi:hypothetical protein [Alteribacter natronophilus]|uniref:hypothetical protein n=1 Tax=Alteribacter natronophilus TaxID=2583810 RepID=UPI0014874D9A|nr:hypothetical protein [Alteribacter natronophilus]